MVGKGGIQFGRFFLNRLVVSFDFDNNFQRLQTFEKFIVSLICFRLAVPILLRAGWSCLTFKDCLAGHFYCCCKVLIPFWERVNASLHEASKRQMSN